MIPVQSRHVRLTCYLTWNIGLARTTKRMTANYHFLNRYCSPITSLLFILPGRRQRSGRKERDIYTIYKHETFAFSPSLFRLVACMFVLRFHDASQVSGVFKTWGGGGWLGPRRVGGWVYYLGRGVCPPPSLEEKPGATHWNGERYILDIPAKASITHRFINVAVTPDFLHKQLYCNHMKHT